MFKLVVVSVLFAVVAATPAADMDTSGVVTLPHVVATVVHEPGLAKVGEYVAHVPSAVSHHSSTVVHSRANVVTPIVAPVVKTHLAAVYRTYAGEPFHPAYNAYQYPWGRTYHLQPLYKTLA